MTELEFSIGDLVRLKAGAHTAGPKSSSKLGRLKLTPSIFEVMDCPLIKEDGQPLYKIWGGEPQQELIVREDQLIRASKRPRRLA
jgi:hypothetical protein